VITISSYGRVVLLQNQIETKEYLLKKHCLDDDTCEVCNAGMESWLTSSWGVASPLASGTTLALKWLKTM
jgi:hypothetical protein